MKIASYIEKCSGNPAKIVSYTKKILRDPLAAFYYIFHEADDVNKLGTVRLLTAIGVRETDIYRFYDDLNNADLRKQITEELEALGRGYIGQIGHP